MRKASSMAVYQTHYNEFKQLQSDLKTEYPNRTHKCGPPVPPAPPVANKETQMEEKCHTSYHLGWSIGKDLVLLMLETKEKVGSFVKQLKCLKEYEAVEKTIGGNQGQLKAICFRKGYTSITQIIWRLANQPAKLKQFLKADEKLTQAKQLYKLQYEQYVQKLDAQLQSDGTVPLEYQDSAATTIYDDAKTERDNIQKFGNGQQ